MSTVGHCQSIRSKFWSKNNKPALMEKLSQPDTEFKKDNWNNFCLIMWLPGLVYKTINVKPACVSWIRWNLRSVIQLNNCRGIRSFTQPDRSELSTQAYLHHAKLRSDIKTHTQGSSPKTPSASHPGPTFSIHKGSCKLRQQNPYVIILVAFKERLLKDDLFHFNEK